MSKEEENKIEINPVGLINLSRYQKIKDYHYYKKTNLFNSCYINSSIQCLFRFSEFVEKIMKCDPNKGKLLLATQNLIKSMQTMKYEKIKQCSILEIKTAMGENVDIYSKDNQEDADEFISNYLNNLIEETKDNIEIYWKCTKSDEENFMKFYQKFIKRKGTSFILNLFYGLLRTENYCNKCNNIYSIKFNSFNILQIPIYEDDLTFGNNKKLDLRDILFKFISEKKKENDECHKCNHLIRVKTLINSLPKCLIIHFINNYSKNKINNIDVPKSFNFENFIYDKSLNDGEDYIYNLKGIIFYSSYSSKAGHYKAACLGNDKKWYYFDDNKFETDKDLLRIYDNDNPTFLFYEK